MPRSTRAARAVPSTSRVARPATPAVKQAPAVKRTPAPRGPNRPTPTLGERLATLGIASLAEPRTTSL